MILSILAVILVILVITAITIIQFTMIRKYRNDIKEELSGRLESGSDRTSILNQGTTCTVPTVKENVKFPV